MPYPSPFATPMEPDHLSATPAAPMVAGPASAPAPVAPPPMQPPTFAPPSFTPPAANKGREIAMLIPALLAGLKDPDALGAALRGIQKGKDHKLAAQETAQQQADRRARESADFYSRMLENAAQFDDEIAFTNWKRAISPVAQYYGIPVDSLTFDSTKKVTKDRRLVQDAVDAAVRRHGAEVLNRDDVSVQLSDGRTFSMTTARAMLGGNVTDQSGKAVPVRVAKPFTAGTPDEMKIQAFAREKGKTPEQLTAAEIAEAINTGRPAPATTETSAQRVEALLDGKLAFVNYDPKTQKYTNAAGEDVTLRVTPVPPREPTAGGRQDSRVDALARQFDNAPIVKTYNDIVNKYSTMQSIVDRGTTGPGDIAMVFEFMKALDPTSVVREAEYATASRSGNIFVGAMARFNGYFSPEGGILPENVKREFLTIIRSKLSAQTAQYNNMKKEYARKIDGITGQPGSGADYLTAFENAFPGLLGDAAQPEQPSTTTTPKSKIGRFEVEMR